MLTSGSDSSEEDKMSDVDLLAESNEKAYISSESMTEPSLSHAVFEETTVNIDSNVSVKPHVINQQT